MGLSQIDVLFQFKVEISLYDVFDVRMVHEKGYFSAFDLIVHQFDNDQSQSLTKLVGAYPAKFEMFV
jgi:hypothetical protein